MSWPVSIRDYVAADEAAVVDLVRELQRFEEHLFDRLVPAADIGPWYVERLLKDCAECKGRIRVATKASVVVGYATILTDVLVDDERDEIVYSHAYLADLCVAAAARGSGTGRALIADCEAIARAAGAKWMRISSRAGNARAREIYLAAGFQEQLVTFEKPLE